MSAEKYYIVRIYRRDEHDSRNVTGLVEIVGAACQESFQSPEQLWEIIGGEQKASDRPRRRKGDMRRANAGA